MRKILAFLIVAAMVLSMAACGLDSDRDSDRGSNRNQKEKVPVVKHTGKKIEGEIVAGSVFSEGLAFVRIGSDEKTTYCINKDGYIVFQINRKLGGGGQISAKFINGYAMVGEDLYDTSGKATSPEDVGATKFYDIALEDGYLLAEKVTATYDSTKKELGVMNTNFKWVLQPSEALYNALGDGLSSNKLYCDDVIYFADCEKYLNIKTGEVTSESDVKMESSDWSFWTDNTFKDHNENIVLDLSNYQNLRNCYGDEFVNGKAPIKFVNAEEGAEYFTIIDEKGNFLFEPKKTKNLSQIDEFRFDGEYLVIADKYAGSGKSLESYNSEGEFLGALNTEDLGHKYSSYSISVSDGVICARGGYNYFYKCHYLNADLTPLFETENS